MLETNFNETIEEGRERFRGMDQDLQDDIVEYCMLLKLDESGKTTPGDKQRLRGLLYVVIEHDARATMVE